jgi:hypothetical protein
VKLTPICAAKVALFTSVVGAPTVVVPMCTFGISILAPLGGTPPFVDVPKVTVELPKVCENTKPLS